MALKTWNEIYEDAYNYELKCANLGYKSRRVPTDEWCQWESIVQDIVYRMMLDCNISEVQARIVVNFIDSTYNINDLMSFTNTSRIFADRLIKPLTQDNGQDRSINGNVE